MKKAVFILFLALLAAGLVSSYEYRMPVNIEARTNPAVLLPGDEATLAIDLANGAASYGTGRDAGAGSSSYGTLLSTPLNKTVLMSTEDLKVLTEDSSDLGMIGPNDKITVYYKVRALDNISSGTHLLDFRVSGGYDMITIKRNILIKVDDAAVSLARAETDASTFNLNVANPRENTLNAVTIVPSADGVIFSPDEYYIGTMDPDEVFTISFGIAPADEQDGLKDPVNLSFVAKFKNGDNWHTSQPYFTMYVPPRPEGSQSSYLLPILAVAAVALAAAGYLYRRRKMNGKNGGISQSKKENRAL
jgi:LPXTG-motif cell wall-anchored protein